MASLDNYLNKLYTDPKSEVAFSSATRLYKRAKRDFPRITLRNIKEFLKAQPSYTLHKPIKKNFPRSRVVPKGLNYQWDLDLADMSNVSSSNDGKNFLIILIDVFSRVANVEPIANKSASEVAKGLQKIFARSTPPKYVRHDAGKEFLNNDVQQLFTNNGVKSLTSKSTAKANYAERFIQTLKSRIHRYMTHQKSTRYIDNLQDFVTGYNNSLHTSLGMNPSDVNESNAKALWQKMYYTPSVATTHKNYRLNMGQHVRLRKKKEPFEKGYTPRWSEGVFVIADRLARDGKNVYKVTDLLGKPITNTFYEQELQPVNIDTAKVIERVLHKRKRNGRNQYFVRWKNYGPAYDRYIMNYAKRVLLIFAFRWVSEDVYERYK